MKKLLSITIIVLVSSIWTISNAQVRGGFKMGVDFSNLKVESWGLNTNDVLDSKVLISPRMGFILEIGIIDNLFVQTGLFGAIKGFRYDSERTISNKDYDSKEYQILGGIDFPINVGYKFDVGEVKLFAMVGPVITYNIYATGLYKADNEWDNDHQYIGTEITDDFKPINMGLNIEGGVEFDRYQFTAFFTQGLTELSTKSDTSIESIKSSVFGLTAAIKFGKVD